MTNPVEKKFFGNRCFSIGSIVGIGIVCSNLKAIFFTTVKVTVFNYFRANNKRQTQTNHQ